MPKRNLGRDPREIRFHRGVVMTNGCASRPVRITRQVKQEFSRGGIFAGISLSLSEDPTRETSYRRVTFAKIKTNVCK